MTPGRGGRERGRSRAPTRFLPHLVVLLATGVVLGPVLLGRGYALVGDMVFVPDQPWKDAWLGADGAVPRAVPSDAVVSLLSLAVPGDLLQKAVLAGTLLLSGVGVLRLLPGVSGVPRTAAALLYVWNPFVYERLAIGHWALLVGYAALPWVVASARRLARGERAAAAPLVVSTGLAAAASPTGGVLCAGVAVLVAVLPGGSGARRWSATGIAALTGLVVNLPWLVPALLVAPDSSASAVEGVRAFAARADTPLGALASLLSFGGIWKDSIHPAERDRLLVAALALGLTALALVGLLVTRRSARAAPPGLLVAAALALLVAWAPVTGPGAAAAEGLVAQVPGAGILRDSHKWLPPLVLSASWGVGAALDAAVRRTRDRWEQAPLWAAAVALLPVLLLPGLAWGQLGRLEPVDYPAGWAEVRADLAERARPGERSVVLPFGLYRRFPWNDDRALLDPAPRFFPGDVLADDALDVRSTVVPGEDPDAARVRGAQGDPGRLAGTLRALGVRWVLVERDTPGVVPEAAALGAAPVRRTPEIELWDLAAGGPVATRPGQNATGLLVLDATLALAWVGAAAWCASRPGRTMVRTTRRRRHSEPSEASRHTEE